MLYLRKIFKFTDMKKLVEIVVAIMLILATVFVVGCTKPDDPNNSENGGNINPKYVSIDWNDAVLLSANDSIGNYKIQFSGEMPELQPGSIITIDQDTVVHHIFIETVDVNGNTVSVTSTEAYLTDIFADTDFTLSTAEVNRSSVNGKVFYPTELYLYGDDGTYEKLDMNSLREGGFGFTHNLWHFDQNFDDAVLSSGSNYKIYMEKLNFDFDIDLEMYMNFGGRDVHEIVGNAIDRYRSKALNVNAYLKGSFNTEQMLRCDIWGSCNWNPGYDIWKHNFFPPLTARFIVYGVPVIIKLNSDLYRQVQVSASGGISAYTGFTDNAEGHLGFEWQQSGGITPVASFSNTFEFTPPTVEGKGTVEAKAWVFPRVRLLLYELMGPSFDVKPYLSTQLSGGFKEEMLGTGNDFCAWSLDCNTGIDAACGLSLQFMGYEVQNYSTPNWNIVDKPLYHSPKRIGHSAKRVGQNDWKTVNFNVYDQNYLFNTEVLTSLPQMVKFEANGQLSSEYGIAQNGRVTVNWTPTSNDILYAKLYDIEGNVMSWDTVRVNEPEGDWVDLGLPSGLLWATRNVGAISPEDYGYYFAWGETSIKYVYSWDTYAYGYEEEGDPVILHLTKYNTDDNLTILQPGDDAATANYGGRMPTMVECQELLDNCTSVWTTLNGVPGRRFTGPNGSSLFLPAAGERYGVEHGFNDLGLYWTSSLDPPGSSFAYSFRFYSSWVVLDEADRSTGRSVRAVREN